MLLFLLVLLSGFISLICLFLFPLFGCFWFLLSASRPRRDLVMFAVWFSLSGYVDLLLVYLCLFVTLVVFVMTFVDTFVLFLPQWQFS